MNADASNREIEVPLERRRLPRRLRRAGDPATPPAPRIPRISRLMALAIKFQDMIDRGEVKDYADLARLGYVTRARVAQIMNLTLLAPDIQEQILAGCAVDERSLRLVSGLVSWSLQRTEWGKAVRALTQRPAALAAASTQRANPWYPSSWTQSYAGCKSKPTDGVLAQDLDAVIGGTFHFCRITRNEVGHPQIVPDLDRGVILANLGQFVTHVERIYGLMVHFQKTGVVV